MPNMSTFCYVSHYTTLWSEHQQTNLKINNLTHKSSRDMREQFDLRDMDREKLKQKIKRVFKGHNDIFSLKKRQCYTDRFVLNCAKDQLPKKYNKYTGLQAAKSKRTR